MVRSASTSAGWRGRTIGFFLLILFHLNSSGLKKSAYHLLSLGETTDQVILSYNLLCLVFIAEAIQLLGWRSSQAGRSCLVPEVKAIEVLFNKNDLGVSRYGTNSFRNEESFSPVGPPLHIAGHSLSLVNGCFLLFSV